jgi:hypothetical protein
MLIAMARRTFNAVFAVPAYLPVGDDTRSHLFVTVNAGLGQGAASMHKK